MKKFAKMSLVAALAVAGTAASAQPLAEAIKNVDVSGSVVYRYDDRDYNDNAIKGNSVDDGDVSRNNYKIGLTAKAKVNDDVTAVTRFIIGDNDAGFASLDNTGNPTTAMSTADANPSVTLSNVYFSYTGVANTTVNVGKQGLTTPWTVAVDSDGNEQTGTGILALTNVGPVTLAGAYFNQTNLNNSGDINFGNGSENVITAGVMANVGPVALDAWYLDLQDQFDTFTVGAAGNFDLDAVKLSVGARHTAIDLDKTNSLGLNEKNDHSLTKVMLGAKMGIFSANVNYGWTDDEGGAAALDNDAKTGMQGWTVQLNNVYDAEYLQVKAGAQVLDSLNLSVNYHQLDKNKNTKMGRTEDLTDKELYLQATYQMSKNFGGYIRFGENEYENANATDKEGTIGRLQVQYTF